MATQRENDLLKAAVAAGVTSPRELANFMAQTEHESMGLQRLEESFRYSNGIGQIPVRSAWRHGETELRQAHLEALAGHPEHLARLMYGGRLGNDDAGDGYRYRGRGYIQLTGEEIYRKAGQALGLDLVNHPELAADRDNAIRISIWYWKTHVPQEAREDVKSATYAINGGYNGLDDRQQRFQKWVTKLTPEALRLLQAGATNLAPSSMPAPALADPHAEGSLRRGEDGGAVHHLQQRLNAHGLHALDGKPIDTNGHFGPNTQAAVREFQRLHGLPDTGVADRATLDALAKSPEIKRGDHGPDVLHVQQMLERAGIAVPKTGTFTYLTEGAVKEFQATHGIEPTGVVSGQTLYELRRAERQPAVHAPTPDASPQVARIAPSPVQGADVVQAGAPRADHPFLAQARPFIEALDRDVGRTPDAQSDRMIAGVAAKAQAEGLDRIDSVVLSTDRSRLIAVQEDGEARRIAAVEIRQLLVTPAEASIARLAPAAATPVEAEARSRATRVV